MTKIINLAFSNPILKINSLIIAFFVWLALSQNQLINLSLNLPIYFYNNEKNLIISGPDKIDVKLYGKKSCFWHINKEELAIFIDFNEINSNVPYVLSNNNLFLPSNIKLVDYNPKKLIFTFDK